MAGLPMGSPADLPEAAAGYPYLALPTMVSEMTTSSVGAPEITEQPRPQYARRNEWVELRVSVKDPNGINVQWYRNSKPVPGATSGSYMFPINDDTMGFYAAIVYYDSDRMTTSLGVFAAMAPKYVAPRISLQPLAQNLPSGGSVNLVGGYDGYPFPKVQWYRDGVAIPGANSETLTVTSVGYYSYYIWNEAGYANSQSALISAATTPTPPPPVQSGGIGGLAFSYNSMQNGTNYMRVGHAKISGATVTGKYFDVSQTSVSAVGSGLSGYGPTGNRCGVIRKPVLQERNFTGSVSYNLNSITLVFDGHTVVFGRTNGTKKLYLMSVNGVNTSIGFGYATLTDPALPSGVASDFGGSAFLGSVGNFYHKRGYENWWLINYDMGAFPQAHRDGVSSGLIYNSQYDSFLFGQYPSAPNVVTRHFGTDFAGTRCNNGDGHLHFMYGFGENGSLVGFMGVETSPSFDGNYISVFNYVKTSISH